MCVAQCCSSCVVCCLSLCVVRCVMFVLCLGVACCVVSCASCLVRCFACVALPVVWRMLLEIDEEVRVGRCLLSAASDAALRVACCLVFAV